VELLGDMSVRLLVEDPDSKDALEIVNIRNRDRHVYHPIAGHLPMITPEDLEKWRTMGFIQDHEDGMFIGDELVESGEPKTLNLLGISSFVRDQHGLRGKSFLAAFKADVDNLGFVFSIGLGERLSISRFCTLSRMLNHFFSDYLIHFIEEQYPDMYVVFAGGDDLFVLGPWYQTLHFAREMRQKFTKYVCSNPDLTLCAGINISKSRLPVRTIADNAEYILDEMAKKHVSSSGKEKDAVSVFDVTTGWENFDALLHKGDWLESLVLDGKMSRGLAYRMLTYAAEHKALTRDGDIAKGMYKSHMCYDFARNIHVEDPKEKEAIVSMIADQFLMDHMHLPLTYALYRIRKE
jgi:CRISPR-associated protein Csm1